MHEVLPFALPFEPALYPVHARMQPPGCRSSAHRAVSCDVITTSRSHALALPLRGACCEVRVLQPARRRLLSSRVLLLPPGAGLR